MAEYACRDVACGWHGRVPACGRGGEPQCPDCGWLVTEHLRWWELSYRSTYRVVCLGFLVALGISVIVGVVGFALVAQLFRWLTTGY
jgi:hypothetical protein